MAQVIHTCNRQRMTGEAHNPHFLLTNSRSDFLALGNPNHSNYDGLFMRDSTSYVKVLSNIAPASETRTLDLDESVVRASAGARQEFFMHENGMVMHGEGRFVLTLDCKRLYDESDQGRLYELHRPEAVPGSHGAQVIGISYTKHPHDGATEVSYNIFAAVAMTMRAEPIARWREARYEYDARRGTRNTPWVFDALSLEGNGIVAIAAGASIDEAKRKAIMLLSAQQQPRDAPALPTHAQLAWRSLAALQTRTGIMAGLPWFFREWSRDELISLGGLLAAKQYNDVIHSLEKWYGAVRPDGTLPAIYPDEGLESSDAPGWLGKRTRDLLVRLADEDLLHQLSSERLERWREASGALIDKCAQRISDGLLPSGYNTTWMDTSSNDDGRAGFRIEIQALFLALYDAHAHLCTLTKTRVSAQRSAIAQSVVQAVHQRLVKDGVLLDGLHADGTPDTTVRPNIFIAWYVAPRLFTNDEWARFFRAALPALWLPWGGLSSIDQRHSNFRALYTGEDVASYHRGDSWYFVNNMAAMAMQAVDPDGLRAHIEGILSASIADMLWQGCCGHCSEISSAAAQEACGTHAQAWSASTLVEALLATQYSPRGI